jgi:hypothetical protein
MSYARTLHRAMKPHLQPDRVSLESYNETLEDRQLHATKGYRPISARRSKAQIITAMVKAGKLAWSSMAMKEFI